MAHRLLVTGASACFRRPEFATDRVSYDVITPIAARRLFEAIYWTPAMWWQIDRIEVLHPIRFDWLIAGHGEIAKSLVRARCLLDVSYLLVGRFVLTDGAAPSQNTGQHAAMFKRRARSQRFFRPPNLGGEAWPAQVRLVSGDERFESAYAGEGSVDLGWMIFDRDQEDRDRLRFYRPVMIGGIIDLTGIDTAGLPT